jgi:integrase
MSNDEDKIEKGFDRGIDFIDMKNKLITEYNFICDFIENIQENDRSFISKRRKWMHRLLYCIIAMVQLRNGSRVSESCAALPLFLKNTDLDDKVTVKIAKSKSIKYKANTKEKYITKTRFRKMSFPENWITLKFQKDLKFYLKSIQNKRLTKRVLDYLTKYFKSNSHSLRYAFINYMLYVKKKEMILVAKFIGHSNVNQLVRYTQNKEADKLFLEDI